MRKKRQFALPSYVYVVYVVDNALDDERATVLGPSAHRAWYTTCRRVLGVASSSVWAMTRKILMIRAWGSSRACADHPVPQREKCPAAVLGENPETYLDYPTLVIYRAQRY